MGLTCGNAKGGAITFNYLMESPSILPTITDFTISSGRISLAMNNRHANNGMDLTMVHQNGPSQMGLTCGNAKEGATTSNYLMESPSILPEITDFTISSGRVSLAMNNGHAKNGMEMLSTRTRAKRRKKGAKYY